MPPCPPLVVMSGALGQGVVSSIKGNRTGGDKVQLLLFGSKSDPNCDLDGGWLMVKRHCAWVSCKADKIPTCRLAQHSLRYHGTGSRDWKLAQVLNG